MPAIGGPASEGPASSLDTLDALDAAGLLDAALVRDEIHRTHRPRLVVWGLALVTVGYLVWLVLAHWRDIDRALVRFQAAQTRWLVAAVALEVCSQSAAVIVQHRLLQRAGSRYGLGATARLVLAQNAILLAVPGGQAVASVFSYRQIRRRGANSAAAAWVVAASNVITMLALATFGAFTATGASWLTVATGSLLAGALAVLVTLARSPQRLLRPTAAVVRSFDRVRRRPAGGPDATERARARLARLGTVRLGWHDWAFLALFALVAVAADCAVWICASHAMIALPARCLRSPLSARAAQQCAAFRAPSTAGLLVAYSAGQAALQLPFLPGGLGLVESFMTATLTTTKVRAIQALSAVLLYRVISFWSVLGAGGAVLLAFRRARRRVAAPAARGVPPAPRG